MYIFTDHVTSQMQHRHLGQEKIIDCIENADKILPTYYDRNAAFKKFGKLYLKGVFRPEGQYIAVITAHWVKKIKI